MRVGERAAETGGRGGRRAPVAANLARGARLPGGAVADHGVLLERFQLCRAPAFEVVVGGVELPHMLQAEEVVLALLAAPHGGAIEPNVLTALPLAGRSGRPRSLLPRRLGADRVEIFRVELHRVEYGRWPV